MQFIFDLMVGAALIVLWVMGAYFLIWKWFLQPLYLAWTLRQWGWIAGMFVGSWLVGLMYLYLKVDDYVVIDPEAYAKGDTIVWNGHMYRVIGHDHDSVRCLHLGESKMRAVP